MQGTVTTTDPINPSHYRPDSGHGLEAIDCIEAAVTGLDPKVAVSIGNALKYLWRFHRKGGVQDLDKAIWYIQRAKRHLQP